MLLGGYKAKRCYVMTRCNTHVLFMDPLWFRSQSSSGPTAPLGQHKPLSLGGSFHAYWQTLFPQPLFSVLNCSCLLCHLGTASTQLNLLATLTCAHCEAVTYVIGLLASSAYESIWLENHSSVEKAIIHIVNIWESFLMETKQLMWQLLLNSPFFFLCELIVLTDLMWT